MDLLQLTPSEEDLSWFIFQSEDRNPVYVEATSENAALKVLSDRTNRNTPKNPTFEEIESVDVAQTGKRKNDDLGGMNPPFVAYYQHAEKPLCVEKRVNQAGDKGRYFRTQPYRVRDRLQ